MNAILQFQKKKYETPLEMLDRLRLLKPELKDEKLSYLGRLDPLAHGEMLVAVGEANKDREKYLGLNKTYRVSFLFGVGTDTGDLLGIVRDIKEVSKKDEDTILKSVLSLAGEHYLPYPMYSSKTVEGKPLHEYGREGVQVELPKRSMEVFSVTASGVSYIKGEDIAKQGIEATEKVSGDFRQEEIRDNWEKFSEKYKESDFLIINADLRVSGGTYIRSLAELLYDTTKIPVLAYDICRTEIEH